MSRAPKKRPPAEESSPGERLQKVLAAAGLGSRRECEELILQGRVEVDRQVVSELGSRVDWRSSEVRVDGEVLRPPRLRYFMLNKPAGVVSTNSDPEGRPRVIDLVRSDQRLFPVGRLDRTSEGLILLTNDGELANQLTHPRYGVSKTYLVAVAGSPGREQLEQLKRGVHLAEGPARAESVRIKKRLRGSTLLEIVLREGRNREVRRLLARIGHKVLRLKRIAQGSVRLGSLPVGEFRQLSAEEVAALRQASRRGKAAAPQRSRSSHSRGKGKPSPRSSGGGQDHGSRGKPAAWEGAHGAVLDYDTDGDSAKESGGGKPKPRGGKPKPRGGKPKPRGGKSGRKGKRPGKRGRRRDQ